MDVPLWKVEYFNVNCEMNYKWFKIEKIMDLKKKTNQIILYWKNFYAFILKFFIWCWFISQFLF
jgi:hypothetical protein